MYRSGRVSAAACRCAVLLALLTLLFGVASAAKSAQREAWEEHIRGMKENSQYSKSSSSEMEHCRGDLQKMINHQQSNLTMQTHRSACTLAIGAAAVLV